jgi:hypothetical protein
MYIDIIIPRCRVKEIKLEYKKKKKNKFLGIFFFLSQFLAQVENLDRKKKKKRKKSRFLFRV